VPVFQVPSHSIEFSKKGETIGGLNSAEYIFPQDGTIIHMGGHLHPWEGGESLAVYLNDQSLKEFQPEQISEEPWSWRTAHSLTSIQVQQGDVVSITANYSNSGAVPILGAMGIVGIFFAPN